jgi:hypothetical protein
VFTKSIEEKSHNVKKLCLFTAVFSTLILFDTYKQPVLKIGLKFNLLLKVTIKCGSIQQYTA